VRVLATCQPGAGHLHPLLPVLRAFESAGHDVVVATSAAFATEVERVGLHHAAVGLDWRLDRLPDAFPQLNTLSAAADRIRFVIERVFAGACAEATAGQLKNILSRWRPDLLIHEPAEYGGPLAAESAGVPIACHGIGHPGNAFGAAELTAGALAPLRHHLGLPPRSPRPSLYLDPCPPSFHTAPLPNGIPVLAIRPEAVPGGNARSPWNEARRRPFIYLTIGTTIARERILRIGLAGLSGLGGTVVATLGPGSGVAALDGRRRNVRLLDFVPDAAVLPEADLVVCHGGWSTTIAALVHGKPLVLLPVGSDQLWNAQRCRALGVGRVLGRHECNPDAIRNAAATVLANPMYQQAATRLQAEIAAMPAAGEVISRLVSRTRDHSSALRA
jgi:UDP:flavonoid glycosyltransferase YjiC (YdhE family)